MSAFIVQDSTINAVLSWSNAHNLYRIRLGRKIYNFDNVKDLQKLGEVLIKANYKSVNDLYNSSVSTHPYEFVFTPKISSIECLKAISCIDYQSCEFEGWEKSQAKKILEWIKDWAIRRLPEWEGAKGWDNFDF